MTSPINMTTIQAGIAEITPQPRYTEEELKKLKKACADFESIFTYQLLKTMRKTIPESKTDAGSYGKDTYTMIMDQKLAESISAKGNGLGLKKVLYDQFTKSGTQQISGEVKNKLK